jgi:hypothetical protein
VKLLKELVFSLFVLLLLYMSYALAPFLDLPESRAAQVPTFKQQVFSFSVLPIQVVQSWLLEQQLESKDEAVQDALQKMSLLFKEKPNAALSGFHFDLTGAVAYYLLEHPKKQLSCLFLPGKGVQLGWQQNAYFGIEKGVFIFTESLNDREAKYFEECVRGLKFETKQFKSREHTFELQQQTYTLNWEKHAFSLELPKTSKKATNILRPNGFHMSSPLALSNLPSTLEFFGLINAASVNYYGAKLNAKQALALEFEALLTFDRSQHREDFLEAAKSAFADWQWASNFVRVNETLYAIKKEGGKQLYICSSPKKHLHNGQFFTEQSPAPIVFAGDPTLLTKLENAGWAAALLELFPIYRGISDFSARTAKVSTEKQTIRWELKEDYFAAGEFLKLLGTLTKK